MSKTNRKPVNKRYGLSFWIYSYKKTDKVVKILFWIAIASVLNYECGIVQRTTEDRWVVGLNEVIIHVCYSFVASFIFYLLIQVSKSSKKKIAIIDFVATKAGWMASMAKYFISDVTHSYTGVHRNQPQEHTRDEVFKIFYVFPLAQVVSKTYPNTPNYLDAVYKTCDFIEKGLDTFIGYSDLFKAEFVECISNIDKNISELHLMKDSTQSLGAYGEKVWLIYHKLVRVAEIAKEERDSISLKLRPDNSYLLDKDAVFYG